MSVPAPSPHPFPWPAALREPGTDPDARTGSMYGLATAMSWPDLTLAERCVAMVVGDGAGGPGAEEYLAKSLGVTLDELTPILWALLQKGFLQAVARWWS